MTVLHAGAAGADAYWTHFDNGSHFHEADPLARPFVHTTAGQVAFFTGAVGLHFGTALWLHKHHHNKLAWVVEGAGITENTVGAIQSANGAHGVYLTGVK